MSRTAAAPRVVNSRVPKRSKTQEANATVSEAAIAMRAYEIFLARRGGPGDAVSDWLQAERELRTSN